MWYGGIHSAWRVKVVGSLKVMGGIGLGGRGGGGGGKVGLLSCILYLNEYYDKSVCFIAGYRHLSMGRITVNLGFEKLGLAFLGP